MLVLLIIFLITIPVVTTSIKVDLPHEKEPASRHQARERDHLGRPERPDLIYDTPVKNARDLIDRLKVFAKKDPQPEVQIRGDGRGTTNRSGA
jgi:biopolymer transport protein ExbD